MKQALDWLKGLDPTWWWVIGGVVLVALVIVGVILWRRRKKKKAPPALKAPDAPALTEIWDDFLQRLPSTMRGAPTTLVIGDRRAGKSSLVKAVRHGLLTSTTSTDDPRLDLYFGDEQITVEVATDTLNNQKSKAVKGRRALMSALADQTPLVVLVVDLSQATSQTLADLGRRARVVVDELTEARRGRPRLRLCVSHIDTSAPGFLDLMAALNEARTDPDQHIERGLYPMGPTRPELSESLDALAPYLVYGLRHRGLARALTFQETTGPALLSQLAALLRPLIVAGTGVSAATLEGVFLAALTPTPTLNGDPLDMETLASRVASDQRIARWRRRLVMAAALVAIAVGLTLPYRQYREDLQAAREAVDAFVQATSTESAGVWPDPTVGALEQTAADQVIAADSPLWPPLRWAWTDTRQGLRADLVQGIRDYYLTPVARQRRLDPRAFALALIYAGPDDSLSTLASEHVEAWAEVMNLPAEVITHVVTLTTAPQEEALDLTPLKSGPASPGLDAWARFLKDLTDLAARSEITSARLKALQRQAADLSMEIDVIEVSTEVAQIFKALDAQSLPAEAWLGLGETQTEEYAWIEQNEADLTGMTHLVQNTDLSVPEARGQDVAGYLAGLNQIDPPPPTPPEPANKDTGAQADAGAPAAAPTPAVEPPVYSVELNGVRYTLDVGQWGDLTTSSRAARYTDAWLDRTEDPEDFSLLVKSEVCSGEIGAVLDPGRGPTETLPCLFTRATLSDHVAPPVGALDEALKRVGLSRDQTSRVNAALGRAIHAYAIAYEEALQVYYESFRLQCDVAEGLGDDLSTMVAPSSWMTRYLVTVAENADLTEVATGVLEEVAGAAASLAPISQLMTSDKGKYPNLEPFYTLMLSLVPSMASLPRPASKPGQPLSARLTPIGKLGLTLLEGGKASPYEQVVQWLDGQKLNHTLRDPFLAAIECAYQLGRADFETTAASGYEAEVLNPVKGLLERFPFNTRAKADADVVQVQAILAPGGSFDVAFDALVQPLVESDGAGGYEPRTGPDHRAVQPPGGSLALVETVQRYQKAMWDKAGKPIPISMGLRPEPLPHMGDQLWATGGLLKVGPSAIKLFNQTPTTRTLKITWGSPQASSVAVTMQTLNSKGAAVFLGNLSITRPASNWSFYRLLQASTVVANADGSARVTWPISGTLTAKVKQPDFIKVDLDTPSFEVRLEMGFLFEDNPWAPFGEGTGAL